MYTECEALLKQHLVVLLADVSFHHFVFISVHAASYNADTSESDVSESLKSGSDSDTAGSNSSLLNTSECTRRSSIAESKHSMSKQVIYKLDV